MNQNRDNMVAVVAVAGLILLVVGGIFYINYINKEKWATEKTVGQLSVTPLDTLPANTMLGETDGWGRPLKFQRIATELAVTQIITSAGKDGQFGTADDIIASDTDHNVSRMVGRYVGQKSKEFVKGLTDEVPTRFDKLAPPTDEQKEAARVSLKEKIKNLWSGTPTTNKSEER